MNEETAYTEANILSQLSYQQHHRRYTLADPSLGKLLVDLRIGRKQSEALNQMWILEPQQLIYLLSCLNFDNQLSAICYSKMNSLELNRTSFYLWMRKRSRLLRRVDERRYKVYMNVQSLTTQKFMYTIRVCECQQRLQDIMVNGVGANKIAIVRNRDIVVADVLS